MKVKDKIINLIWVLKPSIFFKSPCYLAITADYLGSLLPHFMSKSYLHKKFLTFPWRTFGQIKNIPVNMGDSFIDGHQVYSISLHSLNTHLSQAYLRCCVFPCCFLLGKVHFISCVDGGVLYCTNDSHSSFLLADPLQTEFLALVVH